MDWFDLLDASCSYLYYLVDKVVIFFSGVVGAVLATFAIARTFRPKLKIDIEPSTAGINVIKDDPDKGHSYLQLLVSNRGSRTAKRCRVFLLSLSREDESGVFRPILVNEGMQLCWSNSASEGRKAPFDLSPSLYRRLDVVLFRAKSSELSLQTTYTSRRWKNRLSSYGVYRIRIAVSADDCRPIFTTIRLNWTGNWIDPDVRLESV